MNILILNGPNLNMLGNREPEIYGRETLQDIETNIARSFPEEMFQFLQSNHEGVLIDTLQQTTANGVVFNPAAFTHYSYALLDAIKSIQIPVVEVHLSSIYKREEFRKNSVLAAACVAQVSGFGSESYLLGVEAILAHLNAHA
jgi:3-dehydroquinate dehydratase-2